MRFGIRTNLRVWGTIAGSVPLFPACSLQGTQQLQRVEPSPRDARLRGHERKKGSPRRWRLRLLFLSRPPLLRRRLVHHGFELHAVGVGEIDRVIGAAVIFAWRIDHGHAVRLEESAERVHVVAARKLEGVVVEADVALAVLALSPLRVGGGDPEQRLAVAPAGHVGILVLELEAEKAEQLAVELLRAGEVADAEHQVIDADDAGHVSAPAAASRRACRRGRRSSAGRDDKAWILCRGRGPSRRAWVCAGLRAYPSPRPPAAGDPLPASGEKGTG